MKGLLDIFTVSFFGHRYIEDYEFVEKEMKKIVERLIREKEYVDFLVGRDGEFVQIVSSTIIRAKRDIFDANSSHICILPYKRKEYRDNKKAFEKYYDEIEICNESYNVYPKASFRVRNCNMVDRSEMCVFYVQEANGGAWQTLKYAQKRKKHILNIADLKSEDEF